MEQKIDERLQKAAMEYYPIISPRTLGNNDLMEENFKMSYMRDAFIAGAKWQRNSVWHNANEKPRNDKNILIWRIDHFFQILFGEFDYESNKNVIDTWCYLSDILPTKD